MAIPDEHQIVGVQILTGMGWISGSVHLSQGQGLLPHLNADTALLSLTKVVLPERGTDVDFLALAKSTISLLVPVVEAPLGEREPERPIDHHVNCLLAAGRVSGLLRGPGATRLSDYLRDHRGFLVLRHATLYDLGEERAERRIPLIIVNDRALTAVTEWLAEGWSPGGHPPK